MAALVHDGKNDNVVIGRREINCVRKTPAQYSAYGFEYLGMGFWVFFYRFQRTFDFCDEGQTEILALMFMPCESFADVLFCFPAKNQHPFTPL